MIHINQLSFRYNNSSMGALHNLSLHVKRGECILLCGESGCGKTTVTRLLNGLIPHYYEGNLSGSIVVNGVDVSKAELYETARFVGSVFQNPRSQFFCVDTTSEIAFGCENMGLPVEIVRERIDQVAETMDLRNLLDRSIFNLSGGEKQKVACASIAAMQPDVLVLDEPTSNLDVRAIEDLKETLLSWKSSGKTIIIAEHRLDWLTELCDRVVYMQNGEIAFDVPMCEFMNLSSEKTRALGLRTLSMEATCRNTREVHEEDSLILKDYQFCYQKKVALDIPELRLPMGSVVALIGHNGAGKSTLAKCLCGLEKKFRGKTLYKGLIRNRKKMRKTSYMVMQDVNHQLFCEKVEDEIQLGMKPENANDIAEVLSQLNLKDLMERHPMSLSGGQKQRVAIASAILANKEILIFDEPTSGLDFRNMEKTAALLRALCGRNSVFIITHDPEFILRCCTHVVQMKEGKVVESYPLTMSTAGKLVDFFTL